MSQNKSVRRPVKPFKSVAEARELRTTLMDFRPPKDSRFLKFLARFFVPFRLKNDFSVMDVRLTEGSLQRLKDLKGKRCILPFNHPSRKDPEVAFTVGLMAGEYFNYLAAREVFDEDKGKRGEMMQNVGCYSVVRGAADRESFDCTVKLLVDNKQKLVIYREGEINSKNDEPLDCEPGWIRLAFWALQQLDKEGRLEPIYIPRVGTKFRNLDDNQPAYEQSLQSLEANLGLPSEGDLYTRLRTVCLHTLAILQKVYKVAPKEGENSMEQISFLRNKILADVGRILDVEVPEVATIDRLRFVRNAIDTRIFQNEEKMCAYECSLDRRQAEAMSCVYEMMRTVQLFIDIRDGYVKENMTQERFGEVLDTLELEHFGAISVKGKSIAFVHIGEPINLLDWYPQYKAAGSKGKKEILNKLAAEISQGGRDAIKLADEASAYIPHRTIK
ncbi:MAG: hypothetical protein K2Y22_06540 [Candidatus Obscuribacterales bacterium]|nr:hypothetical protein [Candidatus Obscuribacterales bacterium]